MSSTTVTNMTVLFNIHRELIVYKLTMISLKATQSCLGNTIAPRSYDFH